MPTKSAASKAFERLTNQIPVPQKRKGFDPDETAKQLRQLVTSVFNDYLRHKVDDEASHQKVIEQVTDGLAYAIQSSSRRPRRKLNISPEERARRSAQCRQNFHPETIEKKAAKKKAPARKKAPAWQSKTK